MSIDVRSIDDEQASLQGAALLGRAAVIVWNDVTEEGRQGFYRWHDKEHVPERLSIPGFRRGRRFMRPRHSPQWLTMYEADDLSVLTSARYLARLNAPSPATVAALEHFRNTSRAVCRVVHSVGSSTGGHVLASRLRVVDDRREAMCRHMRDVFARAIESTGIVACHLYAADRSASYADTAESGTRAFDVPEWVVLCEATNEYAADEAKALIEGAELRPSGVEVRDAAVYALEICRLSLPGA